MGFNTAAYCQWLCGTNNSSDYKLSTGRAMGPGKEAQTQWPDRDVGSVYGMKSSGEGLSQLREAASRPGCN